MMAPVTSLSIFARADHRAVDLCYFLKSSLLQLLATRLLAVGDEWEKSFLKSASGGIFVIAGVTTRNIFTERVPYEAGSSATFY
jgi:hypothetical protein